MGINTTLTPELTSAFTCVEKSVAVAAVKVCVSLMVTPVFSAGLTSLMA